MDQKSARKVFDRRYLCAVEKDIEGYRELLARLEAGEDPGALRAALDRLLADTSVPPEQTIVAGKEARKMMADVLDDEENEALDVLEDRVLKLEIGPSRLKVEIYNLARKHGAEKLLESTWFNDLMERTETRRLLDLGADLEA